MSVVRQMKGLFFMKISVSIPFEHNTYFEENNHFIRCLFLPL